MWYYEKDGGAEGPFTLQHLRGLLYSGQINPATHIWKEKGAARSIKLVLESESTMRRLLSPIDLTPELLAKWRWYHRPGGSGNSSMKHVVRLCEAIAVEKGWDLDQVEWERNDSGGTKMKGLVEIFDFTVDTLLSDTQIQHMLSMRSRKVLIRWCYRKPRVNRYQPKIGDIMGITREFILKQKNSGETTANEIMAFMNGCGVEAKPDSAEDKETTTSTDAP